MTVSTPLLTSRRRAFAQNEADARSTRDPRSIRDAELEELRSQRITAENAYAKNVAKNTSGM